MLRSPLALAAAAGLLLSLACTGGAGPKGFDSGDWSDGFTALDAGLYCDPNADVFDDVFYFIAVVEPQPHEVIAVFSPGSRRVDLRYDAPGDAWYAEVWADDLGTDCDEVRSARATFTAYADGEAAAEQTVSGEMY